MTNKCFFCQKWSGKGRGKSYHRFPSGKRGQLWLKELGLEKENVGKWTYICADHFDDNDFLVRKSGFRVLKSTAVPKYKINSRKSPVPDTSVQKKSNSSKLASEDAFIAIPSVKRYGHTEHDMSSSTLTASDSSSITLTAEESMEEWSNLFDEEKIASKKRFSSLEQNGSSSTLTASDSSITLTASEKPWENHNDCSSSNQTIEEQSNLFDRHCEGANKFKKKRKVFVGDISSDDFNSPKKAKRAFNIAKIKIEQQKCRIAAMRKQNNRLKSRITSLSSLLSFLKENNYISERAEESIEASLPQGPSREIISRILKGSKGEKYSPVLRAFALTLNFYSPRAYNYVREKFNDSLPHPSTITKWYQNIDGAPGFTEEALHALKIKAEISKKDGKEVFCNLVMDEMSIRKKTEWVGGKLYGGIDIGARLDGESLPEAKEVLVFLATSINGHWKVPVGYFFIDGLSGSERATLVHKCLELLHDVNIKITSLTFDGAASNISMARQLGVDFSDPTNLKTYFLHTKTKEKVFVFLDICHMIKLVRNCLGDLKFLRTSDGKFIQWKYLWELVNIQDIEGLHAATKIKKRHMQYIREKMRVKIASQTLSKSVCDALKYLEKDLGLAKFQGAEETANFCEIFNDIFDILNSRNLFSSYKYKRALSPDTENDFSSKFSQATEYILNLSLDNTPVLSSSRKTGFLGFLVGMQSFKCIYNEYVKNGRLNFLLGYKFSQDHLETLFSSVRSLHGFNNNPTSRQFQSAYKKLLISREVRGADTANAVTLDNTLILNISSRRITISDDNEDLELSGDYGKICTDLNEHDLFSTSGWCLSSYVQDVIIYIAGFVVKSLQKCITCSKCLSLLVSNETFSLLQKRKTYGKLYQASKFVIDICTWGEKSLRAFNAKNNLFNPSNKNIVNFLVYSTIKYLPQKIFDSCGDHIYDGEFLDNHQLSLIKLILKRYFTIRMHHETRKKSDQVTNRVRSLLTHLILYQNQ